MHAEYGVDTKKPDLFNTPTNVYIFSFWPPHQSLFQEVIRVMMERVHVNVSVDLRKKSQKKKSREASVWDKKGMINKIDNKGPKDKITISFVYFGGPKSMWAQGPCGFFPHFGPP